MQIDFENKTKIVVTIGPASDGVSKIKKLILAGADIFRFNTKHSTIEWHSERVKRVQGVANKMKKNIGVMIDLQGSEVRIETKEKKNLRARKNTIIFISNSFIDKRVSLIIPNTHIFKKIKIGDPILIDDGSIELEVIKKQKSLIKAKVIEGGVIKDRKSVNFPHSKIELSSLIKRDLNYLSAMAKHSVTFIALSFVTSKKDIEILRKELAKRKIKALIISKIENQQAINNINEIIEESDAIMIARGDLGVEIPVESMTFWQKEIIKKCRKNRKPVIVATQVLHSMIKNPTPTRAEITDIANVVFDGADAIMLSGETASGKYPIKSVAVMNKILRFNEKKTEFKEIIASTFNPTEFVIGSMAKELKKEDVLKQLNIKTVIIFTESGYTARVFCAFRPKIKIVAVTNSKETAERLSLSYGIVSHHILMDFNKVEASEKIIYFLKKRKIILEKEIVLVFYGKHHKKPHLLNLFSLVRA